MKKLDLCIWTTYCDQKQDKFWKHSIVIE